MASMFNYQTPVGENHSNKWAGQVGDILGTLAGMYFGYPGGGKVGGNVGQSFGDVIGGNGNGLLDDLKSSPGGLMLSGLLGKRF